jgi:hypothetical protein
MVVISTIAVGLARADEPSELGTIAFSITDRSTGRRTTACRIHVKDAAGRIVKVAGQPYWHDHFVCDGSASLPLVPGSYSYEIERGPEYNSVRGKVEVHAKETAAVRETLERFADLGSEGWWSGETHVHRPLDDMKLLMQAEDLHVAVATTWWNNANRWTDHALPESTITCFDENRFYDVLGGEDERGGGALLYSALRQPLGIAGSGREFPSSVKWLMEAKAAGAWVDAEKPFWWDYPLWLATNGVDSVGVAHNHMHRSGVLDNEAWGRPRDRTKFAGTHGNALWSHEIYFHTLNAGIRMPPSAGSASGVLPNPVGYNRMYAWLEGDLSWQAWWKAVRAGRLFVTNGPLLRLAANGNRSGHIFRSSKPLEIEVDGKLDSRDPIKAIELIINGEAKPIDLPAKFTMDASGWFLVRATTSLENTFRFGMTGPWYVEIGAPPKPRISRESCDFFLAWLDERQAHLASAAMPENERSDVLRYLDEARRFWSNRLETATAQ